MVKKILMALLVCGALYLVTCNTAPKVSINRTVNIHYNEMHQEIDGFGGSNAWTRLPGIEEDADEVVKLLYSKTEGMGFTILRNRIPFRERLAGDTTPNVNDGFVVRKSDNTYDYTEADGIKTFNLNWENFDLRGTKQLIEKIKGLGANGPEKLTIMSTPWTPPNNRVTQWKENVAGVNERMDAPIDWNTPDWWGRLKKDKYNDYADLLADYAKNFEAKMGAPLDILSVQNEPNWKVQYESAYWNGNDIRDFLKIMGQRFPRKGVAVGAGGLGVMAPEYENFNINFNQMIKPFLDDPASESVLTHIALHQYNGANDASGRGGSMPFPQIIETGKRFWQTEVSGSGTYLPAGSGIENALYYARMIHFDMTLVQMNAFLYWWLWTSSAYDSFPGALINVDGPVTPALRLYAMGQYSRFIRPGWRRLESDVAPTVGIYSSAYRNPASDEIAIVLINETINPVGITLNLEDAAFSALNVWRTSAKEKLAAVGKQKISAGQADVVLLPFSITTLYGRVKE